MQTPFLLHGNGKFVRLGTIVGGIRNGLGINKEKGLKGNDNHVIFEL